MNSKKIVKKFIPNYSTSKKSITPQKHGSANKHSSAVSSVLSNFKVKPKGGKNDWDGDGVNNKKDCQPHNTIRQDSITNEAAQGLGRIQKNFYSKTQTYRTNKRPVI